MLKKLIEPTDELTKNKILMFVNRENENIYAIMKITEIIYRNNKIDYIYAECISSTKNYYTKGRIYGCDYKAHLDNSSGPELTYILPVGDILFCE